MRGFITPALLFLMVTLVNVIVPSQSSSRPFPVTLSGHRIAVGIYDPHGVFRRERGLQIDHIFVNWNAMAALTRQGVRRAARSNRSVMLTLEPFPAKGRSPDQLADDALSGKYDLRLKAHCGALSAARSKVYFRFGHEMDFDNGRYAWSGLSPEKFIAMFRHAVRVCRQSAPQVITVWSPGGDPSLVKYYPGDDIVDLVGLSLFGLEPWEEAIYGRPRSFSEAFGEKYANVSAFGKPVMIAEFGVCGGERYRKAWLSDAIENGRSEFPLLRGVIYFNDREPHRWPIPETILRKASSCDLERPDWRL